MTSSEAQQIQHPWSVEALSAKAQLYAHEMKKHERNDWQFGLLSTFVLEFLGRAALAKVSPVLLADSKDWKNIYYSIGGEPKATRFFPKSVEISAVFDRFKDVCNEFTSEQQGFALQHISRRNEELHSGGMAFEGLKANWQAHYYDVCNVLLIYIEKDLAYIFGDEEAAMAQKLINANADESAKSVKKAIVAHTTVWSGLAEEEREVLSTQAMTWAARSEGHRVSCPSCNNNALVTGSATSVPQQTLREDLIVETQEHLPDKFECFACKLKISGLSQLSACGLGDAYKSTSTYDAADYYRPDDEYEGYEEDNNEW